MRTIGTLLLGIALGAGVVASGFQNEGLFADAATRDAVTTVKRAIVEGHRTRNRQALDQLYGESYTAFDTSGRVRTKADLLNALPTDPEMVEGRYDLTRVRRWGNVAVAAGHGRMVYRQGDGSTRVSEYDSVNVFEQRHGKWWYVAAFLP